VSRPRRRSPPLAIRGVIAVVAGVVVAVGLAFPLGIVAGLLAGWAVFAGTMALWAVVLVWPMDAAQTRDHATDEDPGRDVSRVVAVVGSLASLGAVAFVLLQTRAMTLPGSLLLAAIAVLAVAASWTLVQVDYLLRYARVYYREPVGGIQFNQDEPPMYTDFAYFSLGLGMTYQVADTNVGTNEIRRMVIAQTLLSYLFGAVILATVINLVTGLS